LRRPPVDNPQYDVVSASQLTSEEGAAGLMKALEMQPYLRLGEAAILHQDLRPSLGEIAALPLEKRYIWRVVTALRTAFADFDDLSLQADLRTLSEEDTAKIERLLHLRPIQFCMMLKVLYGPETMEEIIQQAAMAAKDSV
jgi:hypothetical protein